MVLGTPSFYNMTLLTGEKIVESTIVKRLRQAVRCFDKYMLTAARTLTHGFNQWKRNHQIA